ncbi:putative F-box/LRR-repeat/kelch-repeat protein At1g11620 [Humulus lupulus]|uniref:putative F-box/LRR-repeat/kelch-repeat protein At1g11620 n=1 Tax=Humulus lupulus TaxID=3486 RepID=UPI002B407F38|nr:putative F-box/LRR-repeat/kelch-repeat protein At1g11620 [Humulus lupulus]
MASFCDFPKEIVENIMVFVPADSLLQLKLVNKFCYSLISALINHPAFVANHLVTAKNQSSASLLFRTPYAHVDRRFIAFPLLTILYDYGKNDHFKAVTTPICIPLIKNEMYESMDPWEEIYHCDGLILLVKNLGTMVLCNPSLKESMVLPEPESAIIEGPPSVMGFGFDSENNDYKCVAIWCQNDCKVEIYSMDSNSWREINMSQQIKELIVFAHLFNDLCWRGVCYWIVCNPETYEFEIILSLNLSNEEFHLIFLPELINFEDMTLHYYQCHLSVMNDSVVMYLTSEGDNSHEYHFFVMDEACVGVKDARCWTEYFYVGPLENVKDVLSLWKNDEILVEARKDGHVQLMSCNIRTQNLKDVDCNLDRIRWYDWYCFYVKSLISIRRS